MPEPIIQVRQLVKNHGLRCVLNGVDMPVAVGEVAAIIGPSGGGKSTLLRCINGLEVFQAGSICVEDIMLKPDTSPRSSAEYMVQLRRKVGMVFQQFNLFPHKNVLENVTIGPRLALKWDNNRAVDTALKLLDRVGLRDRADAKPEQLSGGEQQRVAIARTLAVQPRAVLFDEPTSALDPRMSREVLSVISDLAGDGLTMIVVTHAMQFARKVATTVHVMHEGRLAESGPPDQVFSAAASEITQRFLHEVEK